jgi:hypothetical protein
MAELRPKVFLAGARLVWRQQRALWIIYGVNLLLAIAGTRGSLWRAARILNHSLAADRLVHGFNLAAYAELKYHPSMPFEGSRQETVFCAFMFAVFMLFVTGGLLKTYYEDRPMHTGTFFEACGENFWRLCRLAIYFVIALVPIGILASVASVEFGRIDRRSISPYSSFYFLAVAIVLLAAMALSARLWFDMAELLAVLEGQESMWRELKSAAKLLRGNFLQLFWVYLRISLVGWIGFWLGLRVWMQHVRPDATAQSLLVSQSLIVFWLATRLWQRASGALWLRQYEPQLNPAAPASPNPRIPAEATTLEPASS